MRRIRQAAVDAARLTLATAAMGGIVVLIGALIVVEAISETVRWLDEQRVR